jgi:ABC-type oligopeptide transport system substrate-binding subunit
VTLWTEEGWAPVTPLVERALRSLGYRTRVRVLSFERQLAVVSDSTTRAQVGLSAWAADYPATSTFLGRFSCRSFIPRSVANPNVSQFCDPRADELMRRATEQQTTDPRAADPLWARAEDRVLAAAPVVPFLNQLDTDLVGTRVRNDQRHPLWGLLLDQVSVR